MVDNFQKIESVMTPIKPGYFYYVTIIKRRKIDENPEMKKGQKTIKSFYITGELSSFKEKIVELCEQYNARAYIKLTLCETNSWKLRVAKELIEEVVAQNPRAYLDKVTQSVASKYNFEKRKIWILDADNCTEEDVQSFIKDRSEIPVIDYSPTVNGYHIFTKVFPRDKIIVPFEIKKEQFTILYANIRKSN